MTPDYDRYAEDTTAAAMPWAGSVADVQAGRPFVGGLFREQGEHADDSDLEWLHGYTEDAPGTLADVLNTHGPGWYRIRTAPGFPAQTGRRLSVQVGKRTSSQTGGATANPRNTGPVVTQSDVAALLDEARTVALRELELDRRQLDMDRAKLEADRATLEADVATARREAARAKLDADDALDRAKRELTADYDRARRETERYASDANVLREQLASVTNALSEVRTQLATDAMRHAQEVANVRREASDELDGLRTDLADTQAELKIAEFRLAAQARGERVDADTRDDMIGALIEQGPGLIERIADVWARARAGTAAQNAAPAYDPAPYDPPAYDPSPMPSETALPPEFRAGYTPVNRPAPPAFAVTTGDGAAGIPHGSLTAAPSAAEPSATASAVVLQDEVEHDPLVAVATVARTLLEGMTPGVPPAEFVGLIERARAAGVADADWRELAGHILTDAVTLRPAVDALAPYLAPMVAPYAEQLRSLAKAPAAAAVPLLLSNLGVSVPKVKGGTAYLGTLIRALVAAL